MRLKKGYRKDVAQKDVHILIVKSVPVSEVHPINDIKTRYVLHIET